MRLAMSDFIETNNFNKFSLDLNLEGRGSLPKTVRHFEFLHLSRNFQPVSSNPKISWSGGRIWTSTKKENNPGHEPR